MPGLPSSPAKLRGRLATTRRTDLLICVSLFLTAVGVFADQPLAGGEAAPDAVELARFFS